MVMETKLTLRLNREIIDQIKIYALKKQRSLSSLTEDLYKQLLIEKQEMLKDINTPIAKKYKGILGDKDMDAASSKLDYLKDKHLR
jgi:hypothetical protein